MLRRKQSLMDEVYSFILPQMKAHGIADNPQNRFDFLVGMRDAWLEDPERSFGKSMYVLAVELELMHLTMKGI